MFIVLLCSVLVTGFFVIELIQGQETALFTGQISFWLWCTVIFANFAETIAEIHGRAQADRLRKARSSLVARRLREDGSEERVPASDLRVGDLVVCEAGDWIPIDGQVVEGIASVDESAITGESAPVIREEGSERSAVTGGTRVLSDRIVVRVTQDLGHSFLDRMITLIEGSHRPRTPNEVALSILINGLTVIYLLIVITLWPFADYAVETAGAGDPPPIPVLVALLVCLLLTTISGLMAAIGIAGINRVISKNVVAYSGRAVEAAGDVSILLLDKTGTITLGNRYATALYPAPGVSFEELAWASYMASVADDTPEGRSIVALTAERLGRDPGGATHDRAHYVPFSASTRMSGVDLGERSLRKGAADAIRKHVTSLGGVVPREVTERVEAIARQGSTPLLVSDGPRVLGVIELKDIVKTGMRQRFAQLRRMGIRTVMITGDNPLTAAAIAAEAGVDDFIAESSPEMKLRYIRSEQDKGHLVAMTGDGTNDAPALAQSDVGMVMASGTRAAKEAGNMIDLDNDPTKLIEIVEIGKQQLMTRGALTTFSVANDVAKYFAIIPAMFAFTYSELNKLSFLTNPQSAILAAVMYNALVIPALIPVALRGVPYRPMGAAKLLRRNLLTYGLTGLVVPFPVIWLFDRLIVWLGLA